MTTPNTSSEALGTDLGLDFHAVTAIPSAPDLPDASRSAGAPVLQEQPKVEQRGRKPAAPTGDPALDRKRAADRKRAWERRHPGETYPGDAVDGRQAQPIAGGGTDGPASGVGSAPGAASTRPGGSLVDDIATLRAQYANVPPAQPAGQPGAPYAQANALFADYVTGFMLLTIMDAFVPAAIVAYMKWMRGRDDVTADKLRMTDGERKNLEPMANMVAQHILGNVNPVFLFLSSAVAVYAVKIPADPHPEKTAAKRALKRAARAVQNVAQEVDGR